MEKEFLILKIFQKVNGKQEIFGYQDLYILLGNIIIKWNNYLRMKKSYIVLDKDEVILLLKKVLYY